MRTTGGRGTPEHSPRRLSRPGSTRLGLPLPCGRAPSAPSRRDRAGAGLQTLPGQVHSQSCGFHRPAECWGRAVPGAGGRRDPSPHPTPPPRLSSSFPGSLPPSAPPSPAAGQPIPAALLPGCSGWWHGARRRLGELELCAQQQVRCAAGSGSSRAFLKPSSRSLKTDASARPGARPAAGPTSPRRRPPGPSRARRGAGVLEAPLARGPDVLPREGLSQVNKDQLLKTLYLCFICKMVMVWVFMQRYSAPAAGSAGRESGNPPRWGCAPR